jgi:hypothetical protein
LEDYAIGERIEPTVNALSLSSLQQVSEYSSGLFNMYQSVREETQLQISGWNAVLRNCHRIIGLEPVSRPLSTLSSRGKGVRAKD